MAKSKRSRNEDNDVDGSDVIGPPSKKHKDDPFPLSPSRTVNRGELLSDVLCDGYLRGEEASISSTIPFGIKQCIEAFGARLKILAIGSRTGEELTRWTRMTAMENVAPHHSNIFCNFPSIFIIDAHYRVYGTFIFETLLQEFKRVEFLKQVEFVSTGKSGRGRYGFAIVHSLNGGLFRCFPEMQQPFRIPISERIVDIKYSRSWRETADTVIFLTDIGNVYVADIIKRGVNKMELCAIKQTAVGVEGRTILLDADGRLHHIGWDDIDFDSIQTPIRKIAHGNIHVLCLGVDGTVIRFGINIGDIDIPFCNPKEVNVFADDEQDGDFVVDIDCGRFHDLMLTKQSKVITFGDNTCHQCSTVITNEYVGSPHVIDQQQEMGLTDKECVYAIKALGMGSMVFVRRKDKPYLN